MPIDTASKLPNSAKQLTLPGDGNAKLFVAFISSNDATTGEPWCPDVRATLPAIKAAFEKENAPKLVLAESGPIPDWKAPTHGFRTKWNVNSIPTLARFEKVNGEVSETGRMVENELLDSKALQSFIS